MSPKELRELANQINLKRLNEKPLILKSDLMKRMEALASNGEYCLDFVFSENKEIVDRTISLLEKEGFKVTRMNKGIIRFNW